MSKGLIAGISGGVLLALIVGLSIWIGKLRSEVRASDAIVVELTRQRDEAHGRARDALEEGALAGEQAEKSEARAKQASADRDAAERLLAASRARLRALLAKHPKSLPECMEGLSTANQHIALLEDTLQMQSVELVHTKEALAARQYQVDNLNTAVMELEEAMRLDRARYDTVELIAKKKKRRRIVGLTLGGILLVGAGVGVGYALGAQ